MKLWAVLIILLLACNCSEASNISAVFVFGDSVVDSGNNNLLPTLAKANYPPYGKDFIGGVPSGRFSNGFVPGDIIVQELGIKQVLPAYLDPNLQNEDLLTGVNFASGAAGYDPLSSELTTVLSLSKQIELFELYKMKLTEVTGDQEKTKTIIRDSLYLTVAGSNDITNTYFSTAFRSSQYDIPSYTDFMVRYASALIQDLYRVGARKIVVLGIPPIGCLPSQRTLRGGVNRNCVEIYNQMAQLFNSKLSLEIESLSNKYTDAKIAYADVYNPLLDLINNYASHGFKEANVGCCGTGKIEAAELCNKYTPTCANHSEYIFWDSFHPTEKTYRILVPIFLKKFLSKFF